MIRAAVLTVVLTLAGTPVATAACLVWCGGSPCPPAHPQRSATVSADQDSCERLLASVPSIREDSRREHRAPSTHSPAVASRTVTVDLEPRSAAFVVLHEHAPPIHQNPPAVLRL
jgi:hypothetical protein